MKEIETKILEVGILEIKKKLESLGAKQIQNTRLYVDWYCPKGALESGHPWYLRVRATTEGKSEISWKSLEKFVGNTRQSEEININVSDFEKSKLLLEAIGLIHYAHQEKDRISFTYKNWQFDLDQYPKMPAYLEIEGQSEEHVNEAIKLLNLEKHTALSQGETKLIRENYGLDWNDMRF
ncbi:MAG: CYTH domain-containing protein [bacterium]|nr:CYTH domain-containing protein [bacterium]